MNWKSSKWFKFNGQTESPYGFFWCGAQFWNKIIVHCFDILYQFDGFYDGIIGKKEKENQKSRESKNDGRGYVIQY